MNRKLSAVSSGIVAGVLRCCPCIQAIVVFADLFNLAFFYYFFRNCNPFARHDLTSDCCSYTQLTHDSVL